ncbi:MAG: tellurium resistance protein [Pararhodobacter sp.]
MTANRPPRFPPPPPLAPPHGFWRRTPPAIFPPVMGLLGLGLGWRHLAMRAGSDTLSALAELLLGAAVLLFAFCALAWAMKPLRRPAALIDELRILPGRAGVAAGVLGLSLTAAALVPYAPGLARVLVLLAMALLAGLGALVAWVLLSGPHEQRTVTPVFHLVFVGYILAPLALVPLGREGASQAIFWAALVTAAAIWTASAVQLFRRVPPAPLRPLLAVHLAPASLLSIVAALLGWGTISVAFAVLALAIAAALLLAARWLLVAGFSPLWGALTFPLAACASAQLHALGGHPAGLALGGGLLVAATALTGWVLLRVLQAWARGALAAQTNAATA